MKRKENILVFFLEEQLKRNELIKGTHLTSEQKNLLKFNGMKNPSFVANHSFWFKGGKPSTEVGFIYPVSHSFSHLSN
jgi:hypothetical protein